MAILKFVSWDWTLILIQDWKFRTQANHVSSPFYSPNVIRFHFEICFGFQEKLLRIKDFSHFFFWSFQSTFDSLKSPSLSPSFLYQRNSRVLISFWLWTFREIRCFRYSNHTKSSLEQQILTNFSFGSSMFDSIKVDH